MSKCALSTWGIFRDVRGECKFTRGLMRAKSDVCSCLVIALENSQMSRIARIWRVTPISVDTGRFHLISRQQFNKIAFVFKGDIDHSIPFPCNFLDSCWPARWDSVSESTARSTVTRLSYRPDIAWLHNSSLLHNRYNFLRSIKTGWKLENNTYSNVYLVFRPLHGWIHQQWIIAGKLNGSSLACWSFVRISCILRCCFIHSRCFFKVARTLVRRGNFILQAWWNDNAREWRNSRSS